MFSVGTLTVSVSISYSVAMGLWDPSLTPGGPGGPFMKFSGASVSGSSGLAFDFSVTLFVTSSLLLLLVSELFVCCFLLEGDRFDSWEVRCWVILYCYGRIACYPMWYGAY